MSLKARLRLAVALLMSAMVVILSGLYMRAFLNAGFGQAYHIADSLLHGLQVAVSEELAERAGEIKPPPTDARQFWLHTVETDPAIAGLLERSLRHWPLLFETFITDSSGIVRASSYPKRAGSRAEAAPNFAYWDRQPLLNNFRQIYIAHQNPELQLPLAPAGDTKPVLNIHLVISSVFLRNALSEGVENVMYLGVACLLMSVILALLLPNVVLSPLERLSRSLDLMAKGRFEEGPQSPGESKEFAAVYSKLNVLGQQYLGARQNVEQLLERLEQAVILLDVSGHVTMAGAAVTQLLGLDAAELAGRKVEDVFHPGTEIGRAVHHALTRSEPLRDCIVSINRRGRACPVILGVQLTRNPAGAQTGALVTLRDAETRGEVAAQLDMAARLTALSQLTRGVAHEIKNPLNAMRLHLEVLRARLQEETPEVGVISSEISRLDRVVKTFLDFNQPVEPHLRLIDMNEVARDTAALVAPDARARTVRVQVRTESRPVMLNGDPDLLKQSVLNVVVNAMEAMKSGGDLLLEAVRSNGKVELVVADTGPGIPAEIQDKIFNLYFSTKQGGSGIGLAMTFRLIQLQNGKIEFSSEAGRGTTFRLSFPEVASPTQPEFELSRTQRA